MLTVDNWRLGQLCIKWENLAKRLEIRAKNERWDDTKRELEVVVRTYRRAAAQLRKTMEMFGVDRKDPERVE